MEMSMRFVHLFKLIDAIKNGMMANNDMIDNHLGQLTSSDNTAFAFLERASSDKSSVKFGTTYGMPAMIIAHIALMPT